MSNKVELMGKDSSGNYKTVLVDSDGNLGTGGGVASDAVDSGNPTKIGGVARTANPTAVAGGDRVDASFDDLGRQIVWPFQVRDLLCTGYAVLTRATETSILPAVASTLCDIVTISASNTSSIAQVITIQTGTAGAAMDRIVVPVASTIVKQYSVPLLQSEVAQIWTATNSTQADMSDSPVAVSVTAIKNI